MTRILDLLKDVVQFEVFVCGVCDHRGLGVVVIGSQNYDDYDWVMLESQRPVQRVPQQMRAVRVDFRIDFIVKLRMAMLHKAMLHKAELPGLNAH